jgi:hypothetical protein
MKTTRNAWIAATSLAAAQILLTPWSLAAEIDSDVAPPPPRVEHAPPPRDGFAWAPGHWAWSGKSYNWVGGSWVVQRRHMHWVADQWQPGGEKWHFVPGHWAQETDGLLGNSR